MAHKLTKRRGPGRPPLQELTLTEPKTTWFAPGQRAAFVAIMSEMIVNYLRKQRLERARAADSPTDAHQLEEAPGHSPAP
jgi:hypothetical protein